MRSKREAGQIIPLIALCLTTVMGFGGMAVDVGFWEYRGQAQQAATDAAAEGGAEAAYAEGCQSSSDAQAAAVNDAGLNGFKTGGTVTVTAVAPPASGPYANSQCAVSVSIANTGEPTFFTRVLGLNAMSETTQAVGLASQNDDGCVWLLSTTQQSDMSNEHVTAPGCQIYINNSANMSNSTVDAAYIGYANGTNNTSGTTFVSATPAPMPAVSDPCPHMPGCAYLKSNPPSTSGCSSISQSGNVNIQGPACFTNFDVSGSNNTVCGLIAVTGQFHLMGGVTSCSSGVTFYLSSTVNDTNFSNATLTLSAPSSGPTRGVVMWRSPAQSSALNFSSCTCSLTGLLYFPTSQVDYSSNAGVYTVMVFGQGNFSTSVGLDLGRPPVNGTVGLKARLAE